MRFAHVRSEDALPPRLVAVRDGAAVFVDELFDEAPDTLQKLIEGGAEMLERVRAAVAAARATPWDSLRFASAVVDPPVVLAVGLNYAAHSGELGLRADNTPTVFVLWPNSLTGHEQTTSWPLQECCRIQKTY